MDFYSFYLTNFPLGFLATTISLQPFKDNKLAKRKKKLLVSLPINIKELPLNLKEEDKEVPIEIKLVNAPISNSLTIVPEENKENKENLIKEENIKNDLE